jgi:hypothetical protein
MNEPTSAPVTPPKKINWFLLTRSILALILLGLCAVGLAVTPLWKQQSFSFWLWMILAFGIVSILLCSLDSRDASLRLRWSVLQQQVLHWLGTLGALYLVFYFVGKGFLSSEDAGPAAMLLLALSTYLAGLAFDWLLVLIGLLIALMALGAAWLEQDLFMLVGLVTLVVVAFLGLRFLIKRHGTQK